MASSPSLASPRTWMSGASSRMRRKPRRTRLWSSTSSTVILSGMRLRPVDWHLQLNQGPSFRGLQEFQGPADEFCAFAHGHQSYALLRALRIEAGAVVFDFQLQNFGIKPQADPGLLRSGVAGDVVQGFLQNAVDVDADIAVDRKRRSRFLIGYVNAGLPFHCGDVPVNGALESGFVEHDRM